MLYLIVILLLYCRHPLLEDLIDNVFIRDERMERESAMYKILTGNFTDPLEDIDNEYANVDLELVKKYLREDGEVLTDSEDDNQLEVNQQEIKSESNSRMQEQERPYVPGIRKLSFGFPRKSSLNKAQQAMCLRVLLRLSNNEKKSMSDEERKEFEQYMALQKIISEEQKDFLDFAKSQWDDTFNWKIKCNKFVIAKWNIKMQRFKKLPRYYIESISIPLSVQRTNLKNQDIKVKISSCLQQGSFSKVILPKLDQQHLLFVETASLLAKYPPCIEPDKVTQHFRLPVSEDTYCENLAIETGADIVISSSGLKCLLSNIDSDHSDSWLVPVVVKSHCGKNIVYIDKRLPSTIATVPQKNSWIYKYILRYHFVKSESSKKRKHTIEDKLEKAANHTDSDSNDNDLSNYYLKIFDKDLCLSDTDDLASDKTDSKINKKNVSYNLFEIGQTDLPEHERIKHGVKVYRMLVRTKTDGVEMLSNNKCQPLILSPKMEHQLELGAEAVTLEEGLHQWASLKFRPNTLLVRVRIETSTSEIIQIERHTTVSLSNEIKRLYNVKVEDSVHILYNIIERLSSLTPGRYIIRHVPQNGPFAYIYENTIEHRKNAFDLHWACQTEFQTIPKTPWPPIDNMMSTPSLRCFQRMPAMFFPSLYQKQFKLKAGSSRPRGRPRKTASGINQG
ncbi:NMDA receptor-regulated protein 2 [Trachymyrmex septentrionalis]|uniref:NMDA receptor-regulated protein 2 n=1 Tax=Trachymyrmex septentrionalis TaxID=34720 RepID=A0A195FJ76_9HYME|nr:NMDA receptor-regulated protein 2 [Trachymyrmex septentrionalis]